MLAMMSRYVNYAISLDVSYAVNACVATLVKQYVSFVVARDYEVDKFFACFDALVFDEIRFFLGGHALRLLIRATRRSTEDQAENQHDQHQKSFRSFLHFRLSQSYL